MQATQQDTQVGTGPCDYQFEILKVGGKNYRVPIVNNTQIGKVIENSTPALHQKQDKQSTGRREERGKKYVYTHFLSVPISSPEITKNFETLKDLITKDKIPGVTPTSWNSLPKLHLTICMLDLSDPVKLLAAKSILQGLEREIQTNILESAGGQDPKPINLTFSGLRTFSKDIKQTRVVYCEVEKDDGWYLLSQISNLLITTMLQKGVICEDELSHIQVDKKTGLYRPHFHLTLIQASNRPIDGTQLFREHGEFRLGKIQIGKIQISSRSELQDETQRMKRELWNELKDHNATYACESEIYLSYDTIF